MKEKEKGKGKKRIKKEDDFEGRGLWILASYEEVKTNKKKKKEVSWDATHVSTSFIVKTMDFTLKDAPS